MIDWVPLGQNKGILLVGAIDRVGWAEGTIVGLADGFNEAVGSSDGCWDGSIVDGAKDTHPSPDMDHSMLKVCLDSETEPGRK